LGHRARLNARKGNGAPSAPGRLGHLAAKRERDEAFALQDKFYNYQNIPKAGRDQSSVRLAELMEIGYPVNRFPEDRSHVGCLIYTICFFKGFRAR
jgi:hypothetical protein